MAALVATAAVIGLVRVWQPSAPLVGRVSPVRLALASAATHAPSFEVAVRRLQGKMIPPQNLAIGAAAVGLAGKEGEIFGQVFGWSVVLPLAMCVIV